MRMMRSIIFLTLTITINVIICDKEPIECEIFVDRGRGLTACQFAKVNSTGKDTTAINAKPTNFQGRLIESNQVTAVAIAYSEFDRIPNSIFTTFEGILRIKIYGGSLKVIGNGDFNLASNMISFEVYNTTIDEITSKAFEGASNLTEITVEKCEIGVIASDAFDGLDKLKKIRFVGSKYPNDDFLKNLSSSVTAIVVP
ncbi:CLUMA_CG019535, isoform A [Clunio marinus]|uniref:CLUMA_CG019535, isoform A n=1 Tax=Clunio marinus TaxID=568069 RepID=A0A1J1J2K6_9DIPT|nr:CLUMA_CG019535, isoform A [Clunio marinus]